MRPRRRSSKYEEHQAFCALLAIALPFGLLAVLGLFIACLNTPEWTAADSTILVLALGGTWAVCASSAVPDSRTRNGP